MNLNRDLAAHLADWAHARRGWDKPGSLASLARVKGRSADDVAMAWVRFCADLNAKTPGAFPNLAGPHWTEKVAPPTPPGNPKPDEACRICGRHVDRCVCDTAPQVRPIPKPAGTAARAARLRELADQATATHCSHGVDPRYCTDHRPAQPTDRPTTTAREGLRGAHR